MGSGTTNINISTKPGAIYAVAAFANSASFTGGTVLCTNSPSGVESPGVGGTLYIVKATTTTLGITKNNGWHGLSVIKIS